MLVATMHFLTPSGACEHTARQSDPRARAPAPPRRSAEQQRTTQKGRGDSWEGEGRLRFLSPSRCNTPRSVCTSHSRSGVFPVPGSPVPTPTTEHTSAPSGRSWPASPTVAESRLAVRQEQVPSPAPRGAPQSALRSPRHEEGCKQKIETRGEASACSCSSPLCPPGQA